MPDFYDHAISCAVRLSAEDIYDAWEDSSNTLTVGRLFDFSDASRCGTPEHPDCGCPLTIRQGCIVPGNPALTAEIAADARLPKWSSEFVESWGSGIVKNTQHRRELLRPFAEWQRRLDAEVPQRRTPAAYDNDLRRRRYAEGV